MVFSLRLNNSSEICLVTCLQSLVMFDGQTLKRKSIIEEGKKRGGREMKTVKKINVDLNLNSDSLGREKNEVSALVLMHSCLNGEHFCVVIPFCGNW